MGVNGLSVQRYGCEGETSWNCLYHARAAASKPYQPPDFLPACGDPTPRVAFLSVTWVRCAIFWRKSPATKLFRLISLRKSAATNFFGSFPQEIGRHKTISAHFLRKSAATKFFGPFPQEIGRHKTFRLISSGNRPPQNFFGSFPQEIGHSLTHSFPQEIGHSLTHSFPQEIAGWASTHFLRKSLDGLHRTGRYSYILTSNSRFRRCT